MITDLDMRNGYEGGVKALSSRGRARGKTRGSIGFEFARVGEKEDKGGVWF